jgi:hypothetical protein
MVCVSSIAREFAQRLVVTGRGVHDADVGQCGLGEDACYVAVSERLLESGEVIEFHDSCDRRIDGRADVAASRAGGAVEIERDESFVYGAVIAPIEDEDLGASDFLPRS